MTKPHEPELAPELGLPEGRYRIASVAEMTGVPEPTLRAWERRYGIPSPERTAAGYRLYGEEEIRLVREMKRLLEAGISAAEAARVLLTRSDTPSASPALTVGPERDALALAVDAILEAVEQFDDVALDRQLRRLTFLGTATEISDRVVVPVMLAVGERWHAGKLSVAQEHLATQKLGTVMRDIVRLLPGTDGSEGVLLGCFADEEHELGLLAIAIRVAAWGLRPVFLGARTPPSAVRSAVEAASPRLVGLSVTVTPPRPRARRLVDDYAVACGAVPWLVGGSGVGPIADLIEKRAGIVAFPKRGEFETVFEAIFGPKLRDGRRRVR